MLDDLCVESCCIVRDDLLLLSAAMPLIEVVPAAASDAASPQWSCIAAFWMSSLCTATCETNGIPLYRLWSSGKRMTPAIFDKSFSPHPRTTRVDSSTLTVGRKGGVTCFAAIAAQSTPVKKGCDWISSTPCTPQPRRWAGSFCRSPDRSDASRGEKASRCNSGSSCSVAALSSAVSPPRTVNGPRAAARAYRKQPNENQSAAAP